MISYPAAWLAAISTQGADLRWHVTVAGKAISGGAATSMVAMSGSTVLEGVPTSILSVGSVSQELDPIAMTTTSGDIRIEYARDGLIEAFLVNSYCKGHTVTIKLGTPALAISAFETVFVGRVDACEPTATSIALVVSEDALETRLQSIVGGWIGIHPHEAIKDILARAGVLYTASFTPTSTNGHWNLSRGRYSAPGGASIVSMDSAIRQPMKAHELLADLLPLASAFLRTVPTSGRVELVAYDAAGAAVRHLDSSEIVSVQPLPLWEDMINRAVVKGSAPSDWAVENSLVVESKDTTAQGYLNSAEISHEESTTWLGAPAQLITSFASTATAGATFDVRGAQGMGFAGTRYDKALGGTGTAATNASLTASRVGWLLLESSDRTLREIIKVNAAAPQGTALDNADEMVSDGTWRSYKVFRDWRYTIATRGSPARDWLGGAATHTRVYDATLAMLRAEALISRFSLNYRKVRLRLHSMRHVDLQVGDVITFDSQIPINHGVQGVSSLITWQILRAEIDTSSSPGVVLDLGWMRNYASYTGTAGTPVEVLWEIDRKLPRELVTDSGGNVIKDGNGHDVRGRVP